MGMGNGGDTSVLHDDAPIRYPLMLKPTEKSAWESKLRENIDRVEHFYQIKKQEIEHFYNYFIDSVKKVYVRKQHFSWYNRFLATRCF